MGSPQEGHTRTDLSSGTRRAIRYIYFFFFFFFFFFFLKKKKKKKKGRCR